MFNPLKATANLSHQIMQRENNLNRNGESTVFSSRLYRSRLNLAKNLFKTDLRGHFGCVNAIEFSHGGQFLASGGDDKRVLVWDIERSLAGISKPRGLATEQSSNIFCLGFDSQNRKLLSGGNDALAISHDFETGKLDNVFKHEEPVYGLSIDPQNDSIFATASENGFVLLFDQRTEPSDPLIVASVSSSFHAVEFHPTMSHLLVAANSKCGAALYDIRRPKERVIQYKDSGNHNSCMSVRFNRTGDLILALRRRLSPILYSVDSPDGQCTFYHENYFNSCTMKSCTFAGEDDEFVISGSDDFNLYVWRLSDCNVNGLEPWVESTKMVLYGHRSIVNQVRYNREKCLLASSGVEKIVKIWSPFSQDNWTGSLTEKATCSENPRELYSPVNLFTMALPDNWHHLSHDYSSENTNEDPRMMAFFDSLIQQEIEGWNSMASSEITPSNTSCDNNVTSSSSSSVSSLNSSSSSSSTSYSSSSSDSDNEDNNAGNASKCYALNPERRKMLAQVKLTGINRSNHSVRANRPNLRVNSSGRSANRTAFLVANKPICFRRIPRRAQSGNVRRTNRMVVIQKLPMNITNLNLAGERPTTSKAAAEALAASSAGTRDSNSNTRKQDETKKKEEKPPGKDPAIGASSASNANIPSTSTGITSNFRDAFLRLSRQIFMSDSEEDDSDGSGNEKTEAEAQTANNEVEHRNKKPNGANTVSRDTHRVNAVNRTAQNAQVGVGRSSQRPKTSAALNVISPNLPRTALEASADLSLSDTNSDADLQTDKQKKSSSSGSAKRRCQADLALSQEQNISSTPLSELSASSSSSSSSSPASFMPRMKANGNKKSDQGPMRQSSPLKKRRLSLSNYIQVRHTADPSSEIEENNNEMNNNEVIISEGNNNAYTDGAHIASQTLSNHNSNTYLNLHDSGVSLNNSLGHNDSQAASTSNSSRTLSHYETSYLENTESDNSADGNVLSTRASSLAKAKEGMGRMRRNYRKQFVYETESD